MYHRPVCGAERKYEKPDIEVYWFLRDEDADVGGKTQRTAWQRDYLYPEGLMTRSMRLFYGEFKPQRKKILDARWPLRWIPIPALRRHGGQPTSYVVTRQDNKPKAKQKEKEKKHTWTPSILSCSTYNRQHEGRKARVEVTTTATRGCTYESDFHLRSNVQFQVEVIPLSF